MNSFQCPGDLEQLNSTTFQCSENFALVSSSGSFDPATLDPILIAGAVGAGFFCLTALFVSIFGMKMLIKSVKSFT